MRKEACAAFPRESFGHSFTREKGGTQFLPLFSYSTIWGLTRARSIGAVAAIRVSSLIQNHTDAFSNVGLAASTDTVHSVAIWAVIDQWWRNCAALRIDHFMDPW